MEDSIFEEEVTRGSRGLSDAGVNLLRNKIRLALTPSKTATITMMQIPHQRVPLFLIGLGKRVSGLRLRLPCLDDFSH